MFVNCFPKVAGGRNDVSESPPAVIQWKPTRVRWVSETLGSSTGATRVETDQGTAYAKFLGNPEGSQALICEWIGTKAAEWLGLPTFEFTVVDVPTSGLVTYADGTISSAGAAFLARQEDGTTWGGSSDELKCIENPEALAGLIVLDTWLLNCDRYRSHDSRPRRNERNVFLSSRSAGKGKFKVIAMDHTHCFTCGRELTVKIANISHVKDNRLYGDFPEFKGSFTGQQLNVFVSQLGRFTRETAEILFRGLPVAWGLKTELKDALSTFLHQRASFVSTNIQEMLVNKGFIEPELDLER